MNSIDSIYRYPIKGFPGEQLSEVILQLNEGLPGDRKIAISSRTLPVKEGGAWTPCQAFQRMTIRPDISKFKVSRIQDTLQLTDPSGRAQGFADDVLNVEALQENFGTDVTIHNASLNQIEIHVYL